MRLPPKAVARSSALAGSAAQASPKPAPRPTAMMVAAAAFRVIMIQSPVWCRPYDSPTAQASSTTSDACATRIACVRTGMGRSGSGGLDLRNVLSGALHLLFRLRRRRSAGCRLAEIVEDPGSELGRRYWPPEIIALHLVGRDS